MTKRLVTLCGAIALLVCACNESGQFSEYYKACAPESFSPTCPTSKAYTACVDNRVVARSCAEYEVCVNGVCKKNLADECTPESFVSTCADDSHKYICNSDNKIAQELCPSGTKCQGSDCIADDSCIVEGFKSECTDDTHYTVCRNGLKNTETCEGEAICIKGECTTETGCDKATFVSECQGMKQYTICTDEGKISSADCPVNTECKQGECREIPSNACDPETYINTCDGSKRIACDGGVITEYDCADDGLVCHRGECSAAAIVECDRNHFVDKCIGDTLVYCSDDHLGVVSTDNCKMLYNHSGICTTVDGVTGCYRTCSEKDVQEHATSICEPGRPNYQVVGGECVQTADNQYVFVVPPNTKTIECDTDWTVICKEGECVKDDKLGTACDPKTDANLCDGDRLYYCDDNGLYYVRTCPGKCFAINDVTDCYEPCMKEGDYYYKEDDDTNNDKAIKFECTRTDSGLYYVPGEVECFKIMNSTELMNGSKGFAYTGDICVSQKTDSQVSSCDGNIAKNVVNIDVKDSNGEWVSTAFEISTDCGSQTCVVHDGAAFCADSCTAADAENELKKYQCSLYFYELGPEELEYVSKSYSCVQLGDGYYWRPTGSESCAHGCAADQSCHRVHEFEGTNACYSYLDEIDYRCDDNIFLSCAYSSIASAYDCGNRVCSDRGRLGCFDTCDEADAGKMTHTCRDNNHSTHLVCTQSSGKYAMIDYTEKCELGCNAENGLCVLEPGAPDTELVCFLDDWDDYVCRPKCTAEEYDSFIGVCNDGTRTGWICNGYFWDYISSWACEYGCNTATNECNKLHADEGKSCSNTEGDDNYYAAVCDGKTHLSCKSKKVVAEDCGSRLCHPGFGCYRPCETVGDVYYSCSEDTDGEVTYGYDLVSFTCVADPIYHMNYWEWDYVDYCDGASSCTEGKDSCY